MITCSSILGLFLLHVPQCNFRCVHLLVVPYHRTNYRLRSPLSRICRNVNLHSHNVEFYNSTKYNSFKINLRNAVYGVVTSTYCFCYVIVFFFSLFVLHCYMVLFAVNKPIIILYYLQSGLVTWFQNFRVHIQNQVTTILQNLSSVNG
jgi:hypothetical protein